MVIPNNKQWKVENCRVHVIEQLHGMSQNLIEIMEKKKPASTQILQDFENNLKAFCNNAKENGWGILKTKKGFVCHWQDLKLKPSYLYMTDTQSTWHGRTQWDPICAKAILLCTCFGKDGKNWACICHNLQKRLTLLLHNCLPLNLLQWRLSPCPFFVALSKTIFEKFLGCRRSNENNKQKHSQ